MIDLRSEMTGPLGVTQGRQEGVGKTSEVLLDELTATRVHRSELNRGIAKETPTPGGGASPRIAVVFEQRSDLSYASARPLKGSEAPIDDLVVVAL